MQCSSVRNWRERSAMRGYLYNKTGHLVKKLFREAETGGDVSATLSSIKLKEALPVIKAVVNGKKRIALVDSGCSQSFMTRSVCNPPSRQISDILTVKGEILHDDGVETIT